MTKTPPSKDLQIQSPCPKTWSELVGDDRTRYCSACDLHVHNSEALTREDAHELASDSAARVCMRIVQDESGAPVYLDTKGEDSSTPSRIHQFARWALATSAGLLAACRAEAPAPAAPHLPVEPPTGELRATLGEVCPPETFNASESEAAGTGAVETTELVGKIALPMETCEDPDPKLHATLGRVALQHPPNPAQEDEEEPE